MAGAVGFQALTSRNAVLSSAENFILYLLMETKPQGGGVRLPLNLGIVLDRSGSMYDEQRLDYVIEAIKYLIDNLGLDDKAAVVAFADRAEVAATADRVAADAAGVKRAIDDLDLLEIGGGTQMALGMEAALAEVEKHYSPNRLNRLLLLTDGQTYEERKCLDLARQHRERISCSTLGVGIEFNEKLLMEMAEESGANYHFIDAPASIPNIFSNELQGLRNVALTNARIEMQLSAGVQGERSLSRQSSNLPDKRDYARRQPDAFPAAGRYRSGNAKFSLGRLGLTAPPTRSGSAGASGAVLRYARGQEPARKRGRGGELHA